MFRSKIFILCLVLFISMIFSSCDEPQQPEKVEEASSEWVGDADPVANKLKEKGEQATRALGYQKEVKEKLSAELPVIETFTRETVEKDAVAKLGKPESAKEIKLEENQQKVLYYDKSGFALWFWRPLDDGNGPYQYRAALSLKEGKFDVPLHNVFDEGELKKVQGIFEEAK